MREKEREREREREKDRERETEKERERGCTNFIHHLCFLFPVFSSFYVNIPMIGALFHV